MMRALIVDDREANRYLLRSLLEGNGFAVDEAAQGAEALACARKAPPEIVISDLLMPVMDGYTLLRHWKSDPQLRKTPFVVYTATYTGPKDEQLARDLGADEFIVKPAEPEAFLRAVLKALERGRSGALATTRAPHASPAQTLDSYSAVLVAKLEDKAEELEQTNRALCESEARYRSLFDNLHVAMLVIDPSDGRIVETNAAAVRFYGWSHDELCSMSIGQINTLPAAEARIHMLAALTGQRRHFNFVHRLATGELREVAVHSGPVQLNGRELLLSVVHDETERRRAERELARLGQLHSMLSQTNHVLVRAADTEDLFEGVCRAAVTHGGFRFVWIGLLDDSGRLKPVARFGEDRGYLESLKASIEPNDGGRFEPSLLAVRLGDHVVSNDYMADSCSLAVCDAAEAACVAAVAAIPLRTDGRVIGCLSLYSDTAGIFGDAEVETLDRMAADLSFGLDALAQRAALQTATQVVEASPVVLFRWRPEPDRPVEFVSSNVTQWGYSARTWIKERQSFAEVVHADDLHDLRTEANRALAAGRREYTTIYRIRTAAGNVRWVEDTTTVLRAHDGSVQRLQGTISDITERRRAEQALVEAEAQYRHLFDANPQPMWLYEEASMRFLAVNAAALAHYGWTRDEFMAMTIADIRPPEDIPRLMQWRARPRNASPTDAGIWRHRRRDGSLIDVQVTSSRVHFEGRAAVLVLALDVTDQLRAEKQLRDSARLIELAGELASLGGWEIDLAQRTVHWSDEVCRIHDVPTGIRLSVDDALAYLAPWCRARISSALDACADAGTPFDAEAELVTARGRRLWVRTVGRAALGQDGRIARIEGALQDISARRRIEQQARESEQFALATLDSLSAHIAIVGEDGRIVAVNRAWRRFAEQNPPVPQPVCEGANYLSVCESATGDEASVAHAVAGGLRTVLAGETDDFSIEYPCHAPGEQRWFVARITPFAGSGARQAVVAHENVTARKLAELALAASERRFHATFQQAAVGIAHVAPDGRWLEVNDRLCAIVGYTRTELLERRFQDITHPDDLETDLSLVRKVLAGELQTYSLEKRYLRKGGAVVWINLTVSLVRRADDEPDYFVSVIEDIDARRTTQDELRKLSQAVEQSVESIVITDHSGAIEYVNDAFVQVSGYSRKELVGSNPRVLQSGKTPTSTYESMWSSLKAGRSWTGEFHNRRKDGSEYIEAARISPLRLADGRVTHYVAVKEDITAKRRTEIELARHRHQLEELVRERTTQLEEARRHAEAANQAKSAFLANMSHEIRTPMNGVLGMLEVLAHGRLSEDQKELVRTAQESGRTLLGIIDDILDISKIEAGRMQIEHEAVALAEVVESLCETLIAGANLREVDLTFFVSPQIPARVRTDPLRLRQILLNLLGNAIKFSEGSRSRRGRVALRVTLGAQQPPQLVLTVADNGIGMSADVVARLFTPFTQAEASTTRRFGGSGLGLTICKRLVDLMGGAIQVQSQPQGGSTFTITLPCEPVAAAPARAFDLAGVRCVLIESPALDVDGLQAYLEHAGSIVLRAPTPRHALEACTVDSQSTVVIQDVALANRLEEDTFSEVPKGIRHLLITRGRRRRARLETPNVVVIDGPALRRDAFLQGVAVAAGRAPLGHTQEDETPKAGRGVFSPPSVADARDRSTLILVAEDDEVNQRVISKQLELLGRSAEIAQDGAKALRMWRAGGYALLLTDLHMPELDGYALCAAIRREEAQRPGDRPRLPIVALTANALRGEADRARAVGIDDYLTKPLQLELLRDTLNRWLPPADARDRPPTATPATHRATPAIDVSALISLVGDDQKGLRSLLATFLRSMANVDIDLGRACTEGNAQQIRSIVHKLKSAARSVGAIALADLSLAIEQAAMANDLPSVRALMPAFTAERQRVVAAINAHLGSAQN